MHRVRQNPDYGLDRWRLKFSSDRHLSRRLSVPVGVLFHPALGLIHDSGGAGVSSVLAGAAQQLTRVLTHGLVLGTHQALLRLLLLLMAGFTTEGKKYWYST